MIMPKNISGLRISFAVFQAFAVITCERFLSAFWRFSAFAFIVIAIWIFGFDNIAGLWSEVFFSLLFFLGIIYFAVKDIRRFSFPSVQEVYKRIERDSGLSHRPLSLYKDFPVAYNNHNSSVLWQIRNRLLENQLSKKLKCRFSFNVSKQDRYAVRFLSVLLLISAFFIQGSGNLSEKIYDGMFPVSFEDVSFYDSGDFSVTVIYPEYTGMDKEIITSDELRRKGYAIEVPAGSDIRLSVSGGMGNPVAIFTANKEYFKKINENSFLLEKNIVSDEIIIVKRLFLEQFRINIQAKEDNPPLISMVSEPEITEDSSVRFELLVSDDYRVEDIAMSMELDLENAGDIPILGSDIYETEAIMSKPGQEITIRPSYDLTYHPWAGLPIIFTFEAIDGKDNHSQAVTASLILPEKHFRHPLARKITDERKKLIYNPEQSRLPVSNELYKLHTALSFSEEIGHVEKTLFLAMKLASLRLQMLPKMKTYTETASLLWDMAMSLEGGNLSIAKKNLKDAFEALEEALRNPESSPAEISRLSSELQRALNEYMLMALMEMKERADRGEMNIMPTETLENMPDPYSMQAFLEHMKAEAMSGDRERAMEMLSGMKRMMESMSQTGDISEDLKKMYETYQAINEVLKEQIALSEKTQDNPENYHDEQEQIREKLKSIMQEAEQATGAVPSNMDGAEREMWKSGSLMLGGDFGMSLQHQEQAIKHLQNSMQDMKQMIGQKLQDMNMKMLSFNFDPFGNPIEKGRTGKNILGEEIIIPGESERKRVNEILEILRKKSGELYRPSVETEYFRNLLKQF